MVLHRSTCKSVAVWYSLSEEVLGHVHSLETSPQIWISLAENVNKSSITREFSLRRSLQLINKKDKSFSTYYREFKSICDSLNSIGKPVDESMKIFGFLNGLGREYDPITTVIQSSLSKIPAPTFNDVITSLMSKTSTASFRPMKTLRDLTPLHLSMCQIIEEGADSTTIKVVEATRVRRQTAHQERGQCVRYVEEWVL